MVSFSCRLSLIGSGVGGVGIVLPLIIRKLVPVKLYVLANSTNSTLVFVVVFVKVLFVTGVGVNCFVTNFYKVVITFVTT